MKPLSKSEAIKLLQIPAKHFENYAQNSKEIPSEKIGNRIYYDTDELLAWDQLRKQRTVYLTTREYRECFEFAVKMAYVSQASHGTGIRGVRSEVQMADDFILGIMAEYGARKLLKTKFDFAVELDTEVHPDHITPQDFDKIVTNGKLRTPKLGVAVKSSKWKSCFNIIPPIEYENKDRLSDVYIFVRVGLPSDHLFRLFRNHEWFASINRYLEKISSPKKIEELPEIPIWITGFNYHNEFDKVKEIPGQKFSGTEGISDYRYVKSVAGMHNSDEDWKKLLLKL